MKYGKDFKEETLKLSDELGCSAVRETLIKHGVHLEFPSDWGCPKAHIITSAII